MIYIYRRGPSDSARVLAEALEGRRVRNFDRRSPRTTDRVVCWGEHLRLREVNCPSLNGPAFRTKMEDAVKLREDGIPTIECVLSAPLEVDNITPHQRRLEQVGRDMQAYLNATPMNTDRALALIPDFQAAALAVQTALAAPRSAQTWLGRSNHHTGGADLLVPPAVPDYYVRKLSLTREVRVHSFLGRSIRAGVKVPREASNGFEGDPHEWVRSWEGGWRLSYGQDPSPIKQRHRDLAHSAVRSLGLDFGAVDIGEVHGGGLVVLEVNRAPGLEGGTIEAYADAIRQWAENSTGDSR